MIKTIYEKYPRVFEKIKYKYHYDAIDNGDYIYYVNCGFFKIDCEVDCADGEIIISENIPFHMLYGLLESFFDEKGLEIIIKKHLVTIDFIIEIFDTNEKATIYEDDKKYKLRPEAQKEAILKACEILNERLQDEND